ncbi:exodeoxyribonuclease V subunit alpha [Sodalis endosymbiont of Henestaris halophilus]|uniref:exodeoxyribonuclease V subunit alpha n=1 Tax=Sodalis endosymbiont of Henestaris halophilus TaxID=1929246 RepID=UPI000BBF545F|nr:exodeoxyribonuclease V subunit alpha [Sodalis endosymbiont of Henestaris halophilus]SNC58300.1 RecBCD enzyme subunit RecD [Sodalis endosymbiont of Henestaris halophilus]
MEKILAEAQQLHLFRPLDVQFARMLATSADPTLMLASACLSANASSGHVCLPLERLMPAQLFNGRMPLLAQQAWLRAGRPSLEEWQKILLNSKAVSSGSHPTPLVLDKQRLYLQRMWRYECKVAQFFKRRPPPAEYNGTNIASVLTRYFPSDGTVINWQKIAAAVAITRPVALISGGPGTGKTTTVAKMMAAFLQLNNNKRLRMIMAAPTGKAASRLSESLGLALKRLGLNEQQKQLLPLEAITLHHLLGAQPNSQKMIYHQDNQLQVDILIIDEASMIDLTMMANLIAALPPQARVIFLGDRFQLSSVEAGAVLSDICQFAESGYSSERRAELSRLTGFTLSEDDTGCCGYGVADSLCLLRNNYRFDESSGINRLANIIHTGDYKGAIKLLKAGIERDINYKQLRDAEEYLRMLNDCIDGYKDYLQQVHKHDAPDKILESFNRFRLLCALREGPFGIAGLNERIKWALSNSGLIALDNTAHWYAGRPVMILRNAPELDLYNGDIGIFLWDSQQTLRVHFSLPVGGVKTISLRRLPEHETAFAMTVHKSQGSEFHHTALVLPNKILPVLTRELFYTAVTRARSRLSIYATEKVLQHIIKTKTLRSSGLIERLATD